jgi:hypothetical protein
MSQVHRSGGRGRGRGRGRGGAGGPFTAAECRAFALNPRVNPRTRRSITRTGSTARKLRAACAEYLGQPPPPPKSKPKAVLEIPKSILLSLKDADNKTMYVEVSVVESEHKDVKAPPRPPSKKKTWLSCGDFQADPFRIGPTPDEFAEFWRRCGLPAVARASIFGSRIQAPPTPRPLSAARPQPSPAEGKEVALPFELEMLDVAKGLSPRVLTSVGAALRQFTDQFQPQGSRSFFGFAPDKLMALNPATTKSRWAGRSATRLLGLMVVIAISKRNACILMPKHSGNGEKAYLQWQVAISKNGLANGMLTVADTVLEQIKRCPHKLAVIDMHLSSIDAQNKQHGHANVLMLDFDKMVAYRFEPHGDRPSAMFQSDQLDMALDKLLKTKLDKRWSYTGTAETCPAEGPQTVQAKEMVDKTLYPHGFCAAWSLYTIHMRLLHYNQRTKSLVDQSIKTLTNAVRDHTFPSLTAFIAAYGNALQVGGLALLNAISGDKFTMDDYEKPQYYRLQNTLTQYIHPLLLAIRKLRKSK